MSQISTHILDLSTGRPASGVKVILSARIQEDRWDIVATRLTDDDGRIRDFLPDETNLVEGIYRLQFETLAYFEGQGVAAFHPEVVVSFVVRDRSKHHHVPLLLSPFGYSTYRGS